MAIPNSAIYSIRGNSSDTRANNSSTSIAGTVSAISGAGNKNSSIVSIFAIVFTNYLPLGMSIDE
jgi:hypothetical protein